MLNLGDAPLQESYQVNKVYAFPAPESSLPGGLHDPVSDFLNAMAEHGLSPIDLVVSGELVRFDVDRKGDKAGWYIFHLDGIPAGSFGSWKTGLSESWCSKKRSDVSDSEWEEHLKRTAAMQKKRDAEKAKEQTAAANMANQIWEGAVDTTDHPYLTRKGVQSHFLRKKGSVLLVPVLNESGEIVNLQRILSKKNQDGKDKFFLRGGRKTDCFHHILSESGKVGAVVYICEGYATGASIHQATGEAVYIAFDAGNIRPVAKVIRKKHPDAQIVICGDDDRWTPGNPGQTKAKAAGREINATVVFPSFKDVSGKPTDFNDLLAREGIEAVKEQIRAGLIKTPDILTPVNIRLILSTMPERMPFLIADRIPAGRGILITGLGGSSKTRILYQLAIGSIIGHLPFPWEVERTGRAVLVLTEDTESDVHRTLFFMIEALGLTEQEKQLVADNLIVFPMAGKDIKLLAKSQNGVLERTPAFYDMVSRVNDLGNTVFVGIDPALGVTEGDELDQNHQRTLGKTVDDMAIMTGATCALVSHATKASLGTQELSSHNSRGGGAITDAVRAEYSMRNMTGLEALKAGITDPEERRRYVQLCATKGNALPPSAFVPVWLKRDDSGTLFESELVYGDIETPREKDIKILELLETPSNLKDWREKAIAKGLITAKNADGQKKDMDRVKQRLEKAGLIKSGIGKGVWFRTHETETDIENYRDID